MNVQLKDITVTARDGRVSHLDQVYIRGSHVRFFIVPDMLRCVSSLLPLHSQSPIRGSMSLIGSIYCIGMPLCSAHEASAAAVLVLRVVRRRCRELGGRDGGRLRVTSDFQFDHHHLKGFLLALVETSVVFCLFVM